MSSRLRLLDVADDLPTGTVAAPGVLLRTGGDGHEGPLVSGSLGIVLAPPEG